MVPGRTEHSIEGRINQHGDHRRGHHGDRPAGFIVGDVEIFADKVCDQAVFKAVKRGSLPCNANVPAFGNDFVFFEQLLQSSGFRRNLALREFLDCRSRGIHFTLMPAQIQGWLAQG